MERSGPPFLSILEKKPPKFLFLSLKKQLIFTIFDCVNFKALKTTKITNHKNK